jgi:phage FluMu protein Com
MPELLIKCPYCGQITGTYIPMEKQSFESSTINDNQTHCKHCGKIITWSKKDVLDESFK